MKYLPTYVITKFTEIDFSSLYEKGKRIILTDLDNTLIDYHLKEPTPELLKLNHKLKEMGFQIYVISNNVKKRLVTFVSKFEVDGFLANAMKPYGFRLRKFVKKLQVSKSEIIFVGDQILTDIACANNCGLESILVGSITRSSEKWYTRLNRLREKRILNKIKKIDYQKYQEIERIIKK